MTGTTSNESYTYNENSASNATLTISPKPNLKLQFGEDSTFYIQFYSKKKPTRFQRWMMRKLLGIVLEDM